jgi:hypothetical protein
VLACFRDILLVGFEDAALLRRDIRSSLGPVQGALITEKEGGEGGIKRLVDYTEGAVLRFDVVQHAGRPADPREVRCPVKWIFLRCGTAFASG